MRLLALEVTSSGGVWCGVALVLETAVALLTNIDAWEF